MSATLPKKLNKLLQDQKYHIIGKHSAIKRCRWLQESLVRNRPCYKQQFYGIRSHQCIQMTPTVINCNQRCTFCWRIQSGDLKQTQWNEIKPQAWDDPETIVTECIKKQQRLVSGYKGNPNVSIQKYREAQQPRHVAISLAGEPTLYPQLGELIECFNKRGFTTFLVTNGTNPETLTQLGTEPTQLYISLCAPDEATYRNTCHPQTPNAWKKLNQTLASLSTFKCPTVIRSTLARRVNLRNPKQYAKLISQANPTYIEPKAYMHVGFSRLRLGFENMPTHQEIRAFGVQLAEHTSYKIIQEAPESRVILLSRLEQPIKLAKIDSPLKRDRAFIFKQCRWTSKHHL